MKIAWGYTGPEVIEEPTALGALVAGLAALGFWLETRFAWAKKVGASLVILGLGALVSNLGLVPLASPVYDAIWGPITSLAIVWLLFAVDLRDLRLAGPRMLLAFVLALVGTAAGAVVATLLLSGFFPGDAWRLAGVLTGTYSGGSLNFAAVGRAVELPPSLFAATTAADNILTALWMGVTLLLPLGVLGAASARDSNTGVGDTIEEVPNLGEARFRPAHFLTLLALGLALIQGSERLGQALPQLPTVLWLTSLALLIGQVPLVRRLEGSMAYGLLALNLFFVLIGIGSRFSEIRSQGPMILVLVALVVLLHGLFLFIGARLCGLRLPEAAVASQAAIGGPSTAMALASARGWAHLNLPGMVVGLLGYAVGNYIGIGIGRWMAVLLS